MNFNTSIFGESFLGKLKMDKKNVQKPKSQNDVAKMRDMTA